LNRIHLLSALIQVNNLDVDFGVLSQLSIFFQNLLRFLWIAYLLVLKKLDLKPWILILVTGIS